MPFFQSLEIQPKTVAVPFQYLYAVTVPVAEHKYRAAKRVKLEAAFHYRGQSIDAFAHIRFPAREINALPAKAQHCDVSSRQTFPNNSGSVLDVAVIRHLPISMVTAPDVSSAFGSGSHSAQPLGTTA